MEDLIGTVASLWRFPVKSMQGEHLDTADIGDLGLDGDRAYVLTDGETGQAITGKTSRIGPGLLRCRASVVTPGRPEPVVQVELPDGSRTRSDALDFHARLAAHFGRPVHLQRTVSLDSSVARGRSSFTARAGLDLAVPPNSPLDLMPMSLITASTLRTLGLAQPESRFDERRFRMNVTLGTRRGSVPENDWVGRMLCIGDGVQLRITIAAPRCVVTTLPQAGLPHDPNILRTIGRTNRQVLGARAYPCAGIYATVDASGRVQLDDPVFLM